MYDGFHAICWTVDICIAASASTITSTLINDSHGNSSVTLIFALNFEGSLQTFHFTNIYTGQMLSEKIDSGHSHSVIHVVLSARSRSAVMALHKVRSCASLTHSADYLLLVHPLISSIHILLGLPRCLLPCTFPSSNNFCKELLRIM